MLHIANKRADHELEQEMDTLIDELSKYEQVDCKQAIHIKQQITNNVFIS